MSQKSIWSNYNLLFHCAIMLLIMLIFSNLPAPNPITPLGMSLLGIFLAVLYGWTACGLLWPSLLGMVALAFSGVFETLAEFWSQSFGSETIVFILFLFVFTGIMQEVGLINYLANLLISFKFLNNRPWLFSGFCIIACCICAIINSFASVLIFWEIIYILSKKFGFKPYDKWPTLMLIGMVIASTWGGMIMPYQPVPLVVLETYQAVSGEEIGFFQYICFSLPIALLITLAYILVCRFVFRPDLKELSHINVDFVDKNALKLNTQQKIAIAFLLIFIFLVLAPSILPSQLFFIQWLNKLGFSGTTILLLVLLSLIKVDGAPMLTFRTTAGAHISWDILFAFAFIIPFANLLTTDGTGIKEGVIIGVQGILSSLPPIAFLIVVMLFIAILTNFANNVVVAAIFTTLIVSFASQLGLPLLPIIMTSLVAANLSIATPVASPLSAIMFSNKSWCKTKDLYKYCSITFLFLLFVSLIASWLWANIVF